MNFRSSILSEFDSNQFLEKASRYCALGLAPTDGSGLAQLLGRLRLGWQPSNQNRGGGGSMAPVVAAPINPAIAGDGVGGTALGGGR
jgi:hypothetical protein